MGARIWGDPYLRRARWRGVDARSTALLLLLRGRTEHGDGGVSPSIGAVVVVVVVVVFNVVVVPSPPPAAPSPTLA